MEADDLAKDADAGPDDPPEFAEWLTAPRASPRASDQWEDTLHAVADYLGLSTEK